ncbi:hypothetical protein ACVJGD_008185 [Bradyrhizobium sp. USDA 10063]
MTLATLKLSRDTRQSPSEAIKHYFNHDQMDAFGNRLLAADKLVRADLALPTIDDTIRRSQRTGCLYTNPLPPEPRPARMSRCRQPLEAPVASSGLHRTDIPAPRHSFLCRSREQSISSSSPAIRGHTHALRELNAIQHSMRRCFTRGSGDRAIDHRGPGCETEGQAEDVIECGGLLSTSCPDLWSNVVYHLQPGSLHSARVG